jgi:hypothetical protein
MSIQQQIISNQTPPPIQLAPVSIYKPHGSGTKIADLLKKTKHDDHAPAYQKPHNTPSIKELADDVNQTLHELNMLERKKKVQSIPEPDDTPPPIDTEASEQIVVEVMDKINYHIMFVEFVILLSLYVIMSQPFVVQFLASHIRQLNPSDDGTVSMTGILVYGILLSGAFMVTRKIIQSKLSI